MLTATARPVIAATLPAVGEHIVEIARTFYRRMFAAHPELLDGVFNRGNQAAGEQPVALAGSVAAYATFLLERPGESPDAMMARIAHKHASLGVRPDQYPIVHEHLMLAIGDVLGDAVTPEVAAAWDEVYWLMANALINIERGLYSARGATPETIWRRWRVERRIEESDDVATFVLRRADHRLVRASLPGQYVSVQVEMPDGTRQPRQYSLTAADDGEHRQITVKRVRGGDVPDGEVSNLLNDRLQEGDELTMSSPYGAIVLNDVGRPVVFASAGVGITPMAGMLSHLARAGSTLPVLLLHADSTPSSVPLRWQVEHDVHVLPRAQVHYWYEQAPADEPSDDRAHVHPGYLDVEHVDLPGDALYYLCGPMPFMQHVREQLLARGVPAADIQYEVFGPDVWQADVR